MAGSLWRDERRDLANEHVRVTLQDGETFDVIVLRGSMEWRTERLDVTGFSGAAEEVVGFLSGRLRIDDSRTNGAPATGGPLPPGMPLALALAVLAGDLDAAVPLADMVREGWERRVAEGRG